MPKDDIINVFKRSGLFRGLSVQELDQVYDFTMPTEKKYDKNLSIVQQGESVNTVGIIKSGTIISMKYHFDGNAQILRIYKHYETFSLDVVNTTLQTSPTALVSQTECDIIFISYKKLLEIGKISPGVKETIMLNSSWILSNEMVRLMYKIDVLSKRTLQERIMTYLSIISEKSGRDTFDINMNHEQFAQYLCVNRSVLSKELNRMKKAGRINYKKSVYAICEHTNHSK